MLTFKQFLNEAAHIEYGNNSNVHDWGVIHPDTGKLISGAQHPDRKIVTHYDLKHELQKTNKGKHLKSDYPEYLRIGDTLHVRSYNPIAHKALYKGLKHLPGAEHIEHDYRDKRGNANFRSFDHHIAFHKHLAHLAEDAPDSPYEVPPNFNDPDAPKETHVRKPPIPENIDMPMDQVDQNPSPQTTDKPFKRN